MVPFSQELLRRDDSKGALRSGSPEPEDGAPALMAADALFIEPDSAAVFADDPAPSDPVKIEINPSSSTAGIHYSISRSFSLPRASHQQANTRPNIPIRRQNISRNSQRLAAQRP